MQRKARDIIASAKIQEFTAQSIHVPMEEKEEVFPLMADMACEGWFYWDTYLDVQVGSGHVPILVFWRAKPNEQRST